jgi:gamma-glutamyl hydrolase
VVPLPFDLPDDQFDRRLRKINGALITGGGVDLTKLDSPYMVAASKLLNFSEAAWANGKEVWPLWGTCMGMQVLSILGAADSSVLLSEAYDSEQLMLPLSLTEHASTSRVLCRDCLAFDTVHELTTRSLTVNLHHDGVEPSSFAPGTSLGARFKVVSQNVDRKGKPFASTIETTLPGGAFIVGTQWHPERNQFEYYGNGSAATDFIDHSEHAILAMHAVAVRLVGAARLNQRSFADFDEEAKALIYNENPVGDAATGYAAYFF